MFKLPGLFFGITLGAAVALAVSVPVGKETLEIDHVDGGKGAVHFNHAKHVSEYKGPGGSAITCQTCHHTLEGEPSSPEQVKGCTACHAGVDQAPKEIGDKTAPPLAARNSKGKIDNRSLVTHKNCVDGCHKPVGKETGEKLAVCKHCHR